MFGRKVDRLFSGLDLGRLENRLRSEDLLLRNAAAGELDQAAAALRDLAARFRAERVPPPSREAPDPPGAALARLRELDGLRREVSDAASYLRGLPFPAQDAVWRQLRDLDPLLELLRQFDQQLLGRAQKVRQRALDMGLDDPAGEAARGLRAALRELREVVAERAGFLEHPAGHLGS